MTEVDDLLGVAERPGRLDRRTGMARIGGRRRVAFGDRHSKIRIVDQTGEPSITERLELPVPAVDRHPDFDPDVRVGRRRRRSDDAAEGRQRPVQGADVAAAERRGRASEGACRYDASLDDLGRGERQLREALA